MTLIQNKLFISSSISYVKLKSIHLIILKVKVKIISTQRNKDSNFTIVIESSEKSDKFMHPFEISVPYFRKTVYPKINIFNCIPIRLLVLKFGTAFFFCIQWLIKFVLQVNYFSFSERYFIEFHDTGQTAFSPHVLPLNMNT